MGADSPYHLEPSSKTVNEESSIRGKQGIMVLCTKLRMVIVSSKAESAFVALCASVFSYVQTFICMRKVTYVKMQISII